MDSPLTKLYETDTSTTTTRTLTKTEQIYNYIEGILNIPELLRPRLTSVDNNVLKLLTILTPLEPL